MLNLISICIIPDCLKSRQWRMWEYRQLWKGMRKHYLFHHAWGFIRTTTNVYMLLEELKCSRSKQ